MPQALATFDRPLFDGTTFDGGTSVSSPSVATGSIAPGYFTRTFTSYWTPYFPGSSGGIMPAVLVPPVGLAPTGYFTGYFPTYFTHYFPGTAGTIAPAVIPTPPLPGSFIAAVRRALLADGVLAGMLRGGVWHRFAPRGVAEPVLVFLVVPITRATSTTARDYQDEGQVQLSIYGPKDSIAVAAANRAVAVLTDNPLVWRTGATFLLRPSDVSSPNLPQPGYGGAKVFGEVRMMGFKNYGNFAVT